MAPQTAHQHHRSICRVAVQSKMKQRARAPRQSAAQGDRRATWWCQMQSEADPGLPAIRGRPGRACCAPSTQTPPAMDLLRFSPALRSAESKRERVRVTRARSRSRALAQTSYRVRCNADAAAREDLSSGRQLRAVSFLFFLFSSGTVLCTNKFQTRTGNFVFPVYDFFLLPRETQNPKLGPSLEQNVERPPRGHLAKFWSRCYPSTAPPDSGGEP